MNDTTDNEKITIPNEQDNLEASKKNFESAPHLDKAASLGNINKNIPQVQPQTISESATGIFSLSPQDLTDLVNFDNRTSPDLLALLEAHHGVSGVAKKLRTNLQTGLRVERRQKAGLDSKTKQKQKFGELEGQTEALVTDKEARASLFGENVIHPPPAQSIWSMVLGNIMDDTIIQVLLVGASVTLIIGTILEPTHGWVEGLAIFIAVIIVLSVTAGNDWSKDRKFRKLLLLQSDKKVKVIRSGIVDEISSWDVLVGDIIDVIPGDEIPADGLYVRGNRLVVDESPLTGESKPVKKNEKAPFMFSGCQVSEGTGRILATAVGPRSTGGQIQALLNQQQNQQTPLQAKLSLVGFQIGKIGIAAGILTFAGLCIRWGIDRAIAQDPWQNAYLLLIVRFFVTGVTIVVVAVPEGLPLAVTISLAFSMFKMIKDNCFVRHLDSSETMGEATCICTDKTGTLTENRMTVVKHFSLAGTVNGEGSGEERSTIFSEGTFPNSYRDLLSESVSLNSTCFVRADSKNTTTFVGSATEGALLVFISKLGGRYETLRSETQKVPNAELTFSSEKKRMATAVFPKIETPAKGKYRYHVKGASEIVLTLCTKIHNPFTDQAEKLSPEKNEEISQLISSWASEGLRTLVIAYKDTDEDPVVGDENVTGNIDTDLVFLGLSGIKDPIRKEVPLAVKQCQDAGLTVRMVTGDNVLTAKKIATECGILMKGGVCLEGPQFRAMSEEEKVKVIPNLQVLARSSPSDKFILVSLLKAMGEVVAVTGDGTNDAPALKEADVGFAMGICGTQIAMNASDIMLLDDNFASIVQSIRWGRNVLDVIRKFLQFQLAVNLSAILITFFGSVSTDLYESPLTTVQLLWVNLIMDSLGALALASDEPDADVLRKPPHGRKDRLISRSMTEYVAAVCFFEFTLCMALLLGGYKLFGIAATDKDGIHTIIFTTFVLMQIFNQILARQLNHELNIFSGLGRNKLFLSITFIIVVVQVLAVQFGESFIKTHPLSGDQWGGCILLAFLLVPYILLVRLCIKTYNITKGKKVDLLEERVKSSRQIYFKSTMKMSPSTHSSIQVKHEEYDVEKAV